MQANRCSLRQPLMSATRKRRRGARNRLIAVVAPTRDERPLSAILGNDRYWPNADVIGKRTARRNLAYSSSLSLQHRLPWEAIVVARSHPQSVGARSIPYESDLCTCCWSTRFSLNSPPSKEKIHPCSRWQPCCPPSLERWHGRPLRRVQAPPH
jgi:hypothetical protein